VRAGGDASPVVGPVCCRPMRLRSRVERAGYFCKRRKKINQIFRSIALVAPFSITAIAANNQRPTDLSRSWPAIL